MKAVKVLGLCLAIVAFLAPMVTAETLMSGMFVSITDAVLSVQTLPTLFQPSSLFNQEVLSIASLLQGPIAAEEDQEGLDNSSILLSVALLVLVFVFGLVLLFNQ